MKHRKQEYLYKILRENQACNLKAVAAEARCYHYPGIAVACGTPQFEDHNVDTLLNPAVLIEVLSPSTEAYEPWR
jgi:hypothetical protein